MCEVKKACTKVNVKYGHALVWKITGRVLAVYWPGISEEYAQDSAGRRFRSTRE